MSKNNRLTKAEKQQVFNLVASRLVKQGRQSVTSVRTPYGQSKSTCVYRKQRKTGPDLKCAIGQLIPKKAYRLQFDGYALGTDKKLSLSYTGTGYSIAMVVVEIDRDKLSPLSRKALSKSNYVFLRALQEWHDGLVAERGKAFLKELAADAAPLAERFRLEFPPVLKAYL